MIALLCALAAAGTVEGLPGWVVPGAAATRAQPVGDFDGDGRGDLAIGVPTDPTDGLPTGAVYLLLGVADSYNLPLSEVAFRIAGYQTEDGAGTELAGGGDLDGDGYADLAIAAPHATATLSAEGKVYLLYGGVDTLPESVEDLPSIVGTAMFDRVGSRLYISPDIDGDNADELFIGAPYLNPSGPPGVGWLALYHGRRFSGVESLSVEISRTGGSTSADQAWTLYNSETFFGRAAAVLPNPSGGWLLAVGAPGVEEHHGAIYLFPLDGARDGTVVYHEAASTTIYAETAVQLPWMLATTTDGALWAGVPDAAGQAGAIYQIPLDEGEFPLGAPHWQGEGQLGWGLAPWGTGLVAGEPTWGDGRGRLRIFSSDGTEVQVEGCAETGELGHAVGSSPGPDPRGEPEPWAAFTAPGPAIWGLGPGQVWTWTQRDAPGGTCTPDSAAPTDSDGDGVPAPEDCDDRQWERHPGAPEVCGNGVDDNCDGDPDEGCAPVAAGCAGGSALLFLLLPIRHRRWVALSLLPLPALAGDLVIGDIHGDSPWEGLSGPLLSGDLDGSGGTNLVIANYRGFGDYFSTGEVHLFPTAPAPGSRIGEATWSLRGEEEHDYLGSDIAAMHRQVDVLAVGAERSGLTKDDPGTIYFVSLPIKERHIHSASEIPTVLVGMSRYDRAGTALQTIDVDADGWDELAIGAPGHGEGEGRVYLLWDTPQRKRTLEESATWLQGEAQSFLGWRITAGDMDGDGYPELMVGAFDPTVRWGGQVIVYSGLQNNGSANAVGEWAIAEVDCYLGSGMAVGPSLLLSAPWGCGSSQAPRVWSLEGAARGRVELSTEDAEWVGTPGSELGLSMAWIGEQPVLGAPGAGEVQVGDAMVRASGDFGAWVGELGDLNNDGVPDLGIAAPAASVVHDGDGRVWLLSGAALAPGPVDLEALDDTPASPPPAPNGCGGAAPLLFVALWRRKKPCS